MFDNKKVLIIDDDDAYRKIYKTIIERGFYATAYLAADPKEAFDILEVLVPDLIIIDMQMPVMDGFATLAHIRKNEVTAKIPAIACSGLANETLLSELVKLGIVDYIKKPASPNFISQRLLRFLKPKEKNK